jgi:hypothetical protein
MPHVSNGGKGAALGHRRPASFLEPALGDHCAAGSHRDALSIGVVDSSSRDGDRPTSLLDGCSCDEVATIGITGVEEVHPKLAPERCPGLRGSRHRRVDRRICKGREHSP